MHKFFQFPNISLPSIMPMSQLTLLISLLSVSFVSNADNIAE